MILLPWEKAHNPLFALIRELENEIDCYSSPKKRGDFGDPLYIFTFWVIGTAIKCTKKSLLLIGNCMPDQMIIAPPAKFTARYVPF